MKYTNATHPPHSRPSLELFSALSLAAMGGVSILISCLFLSQFHHQSLIRRGYGGSANLSTTNCLKYTLVTIRLAIAVVLPGLHPPVQFLAEQEGLILQVGHPCHHFLGYSSGDGFGL